MKRVSPLDFGRLGPVVKDFKRRLNDPLQLRFILGAATLITWAVAVYLPMSERIDGASRRRARSETHANIARDIEALRVQDARYKSRLPTKTDSNEWVEYLLVGVRSFPIRLIRLEPQASRKHGPYDVVVIKFEAQGSHSDLMKLLAWIEANPRLLRIDTLLIQATRGAGREVSINLTVLGVMG